jgi:hypothetical protein
MRRIGLTVPRAIFVIAIHLSTTLLANAQQSRSIAEIVDRHPGIKKCEQFFTAYATAVAVPLNGIDTFLAAVENKTPACNLLCQAHVVPEFRVEGVATCTDLIAYVFSTTCFGFLPDEAHRGAALQQFEKYAELLEPSSFFNDEDRKLFRRRVGDVMRTWDDDTPPRSSKGLPNSSKAWAAASPKDGNQTHVRSSHVHCDAQAAAYNACRVDQPDPKPLCFTKPPIAKASQGDPQ